MQSPLEKDYFIKIMYINIINSYLDIANDITIMKDAYINMFISFSQLYFFAFIHPWKSFIALPKPVNQPAFIFN